MVTPIDNKDGWIALLVIAYFLRDKRLETDMVRSY